MKTRFSPSPTGEMHLGNVRTAVFNYLIARGHQGVFLLRIEDTDKSRSSDDFTRLLIDDLQWLGLDWDEGPHKDGGHGPYWQSQRQAIYDRYFTVLEKQGLAYPCFCSEEQLALTRKLQRSAGKPPRYSGTCRHLSEQQIAEKIASGLKPALRFKITPQQTIVFDDLVHGEQRFASEDIGDFIIRRADGTPPFMYSNAIDDALMGVTHALRGGDHLANTPRQIMILQALGLPVPRYGHLSLIVGTDGAKLSKRHGSRSVKELREEGFLPIAVLNYISRLGHTYHSAEFMSIDELAKQFNWQALGKSAARFDEQQLLFWQKEAVMRLTPQAISQAMSQATRNLIPPAYSLMDFIDTIQNNMIFIEQDAQQWATALFHAPRVFNHEQKELLRQTHPEFFSTAITAIKTHGCDYAALIAAVKTVTGAKGKTLFEPLRVALTWLNHGPELPKLLKLLGAQESIRRLAAAQQI